MSGMERFRYRLMKDAVVPGVLAMRERMKKKRPHAPPEWAGPPLACAGRLREIMTRHYVLARHAARAMPVAWVTSGAPVELLRNFGCYTIYPENLAALCGARHAGAEIAEHAERQGYCRDLCTYAKLDLGLALGARSPVGRLPKPDLLFCCTNICQTVLYWYKHLAHIHNLPLFLFDTPFVAADEAHPEAVDYMARQLRDMVPRLERLTRRTFDHARLEEDLLRARRTSELWGEVLATLKARPAPMLIFDAFFHMAPIVSLRGLPVAQQYYETLLAELTQRVRDGIGALRHERARLLWDNIAVWFKVADFSRRLGEAGLAAVAATYTNAWAESTHYLDVADPFRSLALTYSMIVLNRDLAYRTGLMERMIRDYRIDGILFHSCRSCKPYSLGQLDVARQLQESCGVKTAFLEADTSDPRMYAEDAGNTRLEAFIEALG